MANEELDALKEEAKDLGIEFSANIGASKLKEKIDAFYESQETSGEELKAAMAAVEQAEEKAVVSSKAAPKGELKGKQKMVALAQELFDKAKVTKIVTIIDNDQRVNNQTTTCKANWSNAYFDLGTRIFPLNTPIEIPQGFIDVLKEVMIPHHTKDNKTGLSAVVMRARYSVSVSDVEK